MSRFLRSIVTLVAGFAMLAVLSPAPQASANMVRTLRYDASRAAEFRGVIDQAAQIWNSSVRNVRLVAGTPADFIVYADNGWPRAQPTSLGRGYVWIGRQATSQGHNPLRISTHEIGHILGMPDRRTGRCTDLMSGASAGTSCTNPNPSAAERAEVDRYFAGWLAPKVQFNQLHVDQSLETVK
ncbi:snapalysin family zinc-dependent metalloprotease [Spongiactinospora sp. TRM90649]|uniref:snapalysin family zinc-dependent metalloprotease n=1 Tax=Spongiactinospora sp. TRM90649 TaxID=3031114 RepID=UPI0023F725AC|nr:snapalysin family zinc-dependent metalloprotease [Spongiactinospora sp. TRM90649]MDF5756949.1 snapalysin family zinc-dependent metalloprotease [Spongiactinospora sp. TRM90649]